MSRDGTDPQLDVPKPVADGVWIVDSSPQRVLGLRFPARMTVLRLADGGLWLHSPTRHAAPLAASLLRLGPIRHLVAPGTAHWTHLPAWQSAFPGAALWAAPTVPERARRQGAALRVDHVVGPEPPAAWSGEIDHAVLQAPGFVEIAFFHRPTATLILTDTLQNMEPARLPLPTRLFARAVGAAAPEGGTPLHLRLLLRWDAAANRAVAERLIALAPRRVVFAHGAWFEADGAARLERAFAWLLRP